MKFPADKFEQLKTWIESAETDEIREAYRSGNIPRADAVKDINKRYRWDLYWHVLNQHDRDHTWREFTSELNDSHIDTALKRIVRPL